MVDEFSFFKKMNLGRAFEHNFGSKTGIWRSSNTREEGSWSFELIDT